MTLTRTNSRKIFLTIVASLAFAAGTQQAHASVNTPVESYSATKTFTTATSPQAHAAFDFFSPFKWAWSQLKSVSDAAERFLAKHPNLTLVRKIAGKVVVVYSIYLFMKVYHNSMVKKCPWLKHKKGFVIVPHRCEPSAKATGTNLFHAFVF